MSMLKKDLFKISLLLIFFSCAGKLKLIDINPGLKLNSDLYLSNGMKLSNREIVSIDADQVTLDVENSVSFERDSIEKIFLRNVFLDIPETLKTSFYTVSFSEMDKEPYHYLYNFEKWPVKIQVVEWVDNYLKVNAQNEQLGYLPLYLDLNKLKSQLSIQEESEFIKLLFNDSSLTMNEKAENDTLWIKCLQSSQYPAQWISAVKTSAYNNISSKKKRKFSLYRGSEVILIDSTEHYYKVLMCDEESLLGHRFGWVKKGNMSTTMINPLTKEQAENLIRQEKRKKFIHSHKMPQRFKNAILKGSIREGMTREMVRVSWGKPNTKKNLGRKYYYPIVWTYQKNNTEYILNFTKKGILKTINEKRP